MGPPKVLVIGGGPAGSACAIRLCQLARARQVGLQVELAERVRFPRAKVCGCCLGGAGLEALERLGCRDWVESQGCRLRRWRGSFDGRAVELELPRGLAISRESLDSGLLAEAKRCGTRVHQPATAELLLDGASNGGGDVAVRLRDDTTEWVERYQIVVLAGGLNAHIGGRSGRPSLLPWIDPPHGPFGVACTIPWASESRDFESPSTAQPSGAGAFEEGVVYMACDDRGYVGMVGLEDGRIDVAAALHRGRIPKGKRERLAGGERSLGNREATLRQVEAILDRSGLPAPSLRAQALTTGPLHRRRLAGRGRVMAIGDAAGYVEPFTGEGMTWGMLTGIAAANRIAAEWEHPSGIGDRWVLEHHSLMRKRRNRCRRVAWAIHSSTIRGIAGRALQRFPWLATPLLRGLERGT